MFKTIQKISKIRELPVLLAAAVTTGTMMPLDANAASGSTIGAIAETLITQVGSVGKVITAGGVVVGIVLMITGLVKLKQAAESNGQVKYSEGLWRCVVGAGLIAIPALSGVLASTFGIQDGLTTISAGGGATF